MNSNEQYSCVNVVHRCFPERRFNSMTCRLSGALASKVKGLLINISLAS